MYYSTGLFYVLRLLYVYYSTHLFYVYSTCITLRACSTSSLRVQKRALRYRLSVSHISAHGLLTWKLVPFEQPYRTRRLPVTKDRSRRSRYQSINQVKSHSCTDIILGRSQSGIETNRYWVILLGQLLLLLLLLHQVK